MALQDPLNYPDFNFNLIIPFTALSSKYIFTSFEVGRLYFRLHSALHPQAKASFL